MELMSQTALAKMLNVNVQTVFMAINRGEIKKHREGRRGQLDIHDPLTVAFIQRITTKKKNEHEDKIQMKAGNKKKQSSGDDDQGEDLNGNLTALSKTSVDKIKVIEQIKALQLKTEQERKNLISRDLIQKVFSKLYIIDSNELKTIGEKISPDIMAICGVEDNEMQLKINKLIEDEIYKILQHIKRVMNDFLIKIESEEIK